MDELATLPSAHPQTGAEAGRLEIADREDVVKDGAELTAFSRKIHLAIDAAGVHLFP